MHSACAQDHESKEVVHLLGHKPFIYIQVSGAGSAEARSQQRFPPVSLLKQRSPSPTEMASGASLSGTLLDGRPPRMHALLTHLHRGLNNIIKNDHQRAHCKQITLVGAWRTNPAKGRTRSEAICGSGESASARSFFFFFLFLQTFTHTFLWLLGETPGRLQRDMFYRLKSVFLCSDLL